MMLGPRPGTPCRLAPWHVTQLIRYSCRPWAIRSAPFCAAACGAGLSRRTTSRRAAAQHRARPPAATCAVASRPSAASSVCAPGHRCRRPGPVFGAAGLAHLRPLPTAEFAEHVSPAGQLGTRRALRPRVPPAASDLHGGLRCPSATSSRHVLEGAHDRGLRRRARHRVRRPARPAALGGTDRRTGPPRDRVRGRVPDLRRPAAARPAPPAARPAHRAARGDGRGRVRRAAAAARRGRPRGSGGHVLAVGSQAGALRLQLPVVVPPAAASTTCPTAPTPAAARTVVPGPPSATAAPGC